MSKENRVKAQRYQTKRDTTRMELRFVHEYMNNGMCGAEAVRAAGYKARNTNVASTMACELLGRPNIQREIQLIKDKIVTSFALTQEKVSSELAAIAFSDISDYVDIREDEKLIYAVDEEGEDTTTKEKYAVVLIKLMKAMKNTKAISSIKQGKHGIEIRLWDKVKALDLLGQYMKMWTEGKKDDPDNKPDYSKLSSEEMHQLYNLLAKTKT